MKKILLSISAFALTSAAWSQVIVAGVSPASVVASYDFGVQTHEGWPGQAGDGTWSLALDFNIPGTYVEDTLMLVDDGTPGTNAQGHPIAQEGCGPLQNDLTGKIAVIYRNTCEFGTKVFNAQNAGAVAAIIINREPVSALNMLGGADGLNVTIPAVFISSIDGEILVNAMNQGPVVCFIGNKIGAFPNDVGSDRGQALISPYGAPVTEIFDGFDLGLQIYNWGSNPQAGVNVNATITGPSGVVYNETVGPIAMNSGDTVPIFNGNTYAFPPFNLGGLGNYPVGDYTLTYDIDLGTADNSPFDNTFNSQFTVNEEVLSLATLTGGMVNTGNYPSNSTTEYQSCMFYEEQASQNGQLLIDGVYLVPFIDTNNFPIAGEEIFVNIYEWNDTWVDLDDPGPATNNDWFTDLNQIAYTTYYPASNSESGQVQFASLSPTVSLNDNQRYLVCLQTFSDNLVFGYDNSLDYSGNTGIFRMPVSPVHVDGTWYTGGWNGSTTPSIGLRLAVGGIEEVADLEGKAFPNPANNNVTLVVNQSGNANVVVTDVAGHAVMNKTMFFDNGVAKVNIDTLSSGVYIFNVVMEDGSAAQINVVKN